MTHFLNDPQHFHRYCECDAALLEEEFGSEELELVRGDDTFICTQYLECMYRWRPTRTPRS